MIKKIISRFYNQRIEDMSTRILYFFNTIDTYFIIAGLAALIIIYGVGNYSIPALIIIAVAAAAVFKTADFYPLFLVFTPVFLFFLFRGSALTLQETGLILLANLGIFALIQFLFMGIPDIIVARDMTVGFRLFWNSIFTIAPTAVSLPISVYFSTLFTLILAARPNPLNINGGMFWITIWIAAFITHSYKPRSFRSSDFRPEIIKRISEKVVILNIDGCRLDRFYEAKLPFLTSLEAESTYFPNGLQTVYRALTNPAFASMLTGVVPEVHGIKSNNLGQAIKIKALPDLVKTVLYGSMHIKHFSKPHWDTRIVSLPRHSVYKSDDIMFDWLKEDLIKKEGRRLFVADISEADFLGHAYGSESGQYLEALKRADRRIEKFFEWLKRENLTEGTVIIICSDHGIKRIDHSYLLSGAERYVPFIITGSRIKRNNPLAFEASIMDIAPTISYLLGLPYPIDQRGRVFLEAVA